MTKPLAGALMALATLANAQTDIGCQPRRFGKFSEWSSPVNPGPVVNSSTGDRWTAIAPNSISPPTAPEGWATRTFMSLAAPASKAPWGTSQGLGPAINSPARENNPTLSRDGHWLIFGSDRTEGRCNGHSAGEFYISYRENTGDDFAWEPPVNLSCQFAGDEENAGISFFDDENKGITTFYFSSARPGGQGGFDFYKSERGFNGAFSPPVPVSELNTPLADVNLTVRSDGLEMILSYNYTTILVNGDLWVSTRETTSQPWTTPKSLGPTINSDNDDAFANLSCDGTTLYFASNRPGGSGGADLYFTTRTRLDDPAPVLLALSGDGKGQGAILHARTTQAVTSTNPAMAGEALEIYATGVGTGSNVSVPQITIGGLRAEILFWQFSRIYRPQPAEYPRTGRCGGGPGCPRPADPFWTTEQRSHDRRAVKAAAATNQHS